MLLIQNKNIMDILGNETEDDYAEDEEVISPIPSLNIWLQLFIIFLPYLFIIIIYMLS
jgi:hypothetical protein